VLVAGVMPKLNYTNAADNVIVAGGNLKITAKKSRFKLHISTIKI
jgi:hypothetical protein